MFLGHFGVALAAKRVAPGPSLGTAVMAAQWADGIWPLFVLLGLEHVEIRPGITAVTPFDFVSYPYTHSLLPTSGGQRCSRSFTEHCARTGAAQSGSPPS